MLLHSKPRPGRAIRSPKSAGKSAVLSERYKFASWVRCRIATFQALCYHSPSEYASSFGNIALRRTLLAAGLFLIVVESVRAQSGQIPVSDQELEARRAPQAAFPPMPVGPGGEDYSRPLPEYPDPMAEPPCGEPPWGEPACAHIGWRIGIEFNPTTSKISDGKNIDFETEDSILASRFIIDFERADGIGYRFQYWDFDERVRFPFPWGEIRTEATTLYFDVSERYVDGDAELQFGAGPAFARLQVGHSKNQFIGVGASVFGEGFYPFLRYPTTELGVTGHARLAVLGAAEEDVIHDPVATIDDLGWGLELRHKYGAHLDKYWFIDALREIQFWTGSSHPFAADEVFQGASFKLGLGW